PDLAAIHTQSGDTLAARGNVDVAIAEYRKALRLSPDLQQAQNGLQAALAKKGEGHS
ncbi:MAG: glycosyltransferase, partial [Acidobacteria bacterium]